MAQPVLLAQVVVPQVNHHWEALLMAVKAGMLDQPELPVLELVAGLLQ
jgi:hypothetical protein